jgi:hypothetical protein
MKETGFSRKQFLVAASGMATLLAMPLTAVAQQPKIKPPPLQPPMVKEFVAAAHVNLAKTKEMLGNEPHLLNATWDWSNGDFEMAIGGAGHMGNREIAMFLIGEGARYDVFVAAMLGELDMVKSVLAAHPNALNAKGPHGIPLLAHAKAGGEDSAHVLEYLQSLKAS